jgi:hypothetical protein
VQVQRDGPVGQLDGRLVRVMLQEISATHGSHGKAGRDRGSRPSPPRLVEPHDHGVGSLGALDRLDDDAGRVDVEGAPAQVRAGAGAGA